MLFHSHFFVFVFLPLVLLCLALGRFFLSTPGERRRWSLLILTVASCIFYAYAEPGDLPLLMMSVAFNWWIGNTSRNRLTLAIGIFCNLTLLAYYKYLPALAGGTLEKNARLPLAISFFTFQQIAYIVDRYKNKTKPAPFGTYITAVSFFPHLIAGPIVRYQELAVQFLKKNWGHLSGAAIQSGILLFILGIIKKFWIADSFSAVVSHGMQLSTGSTSISMLEAWRIALSYTFQIYFDFSGYSTMAIGLAKIFGIRFPENFRSPYQATSLIDFWHRWHITLSTFLRDYVYITLGGNRLGSWRKYCNLFITFVLGGIWHGAGWTFILWGALHGAGVTLNHLWRDFGPASLKIPRVIGRACTFVFVIFTWVPFRAPDFQSTLRLWTSMLSFDDEWELRLESIDYLTSLAYVIQHLNWPFSAAHLHVGYALLEWLWIACIGAVCFVMPSAETWIDKGKWHWIHGVVIGWIFFYYIQSAWVGRASEFIYFRF